MSVVKEWEYGQIPHRPENVKRYDMIRCKAPILFKGAKIRIYCDQPMQIIRKRDAMIEIKPGTLLCRAWKGHVIKCGMMYIAFCKNVKNHLNGKCNVVCGNCIENWDIIDSHPGNYEIVKNAYTYSRKKRS